MADEPKKRRSLRDRLAANPVGGFFVAPSEDSGEENDADTSAPRPHRERIDVTSAAPPLAAPPVPGAAAREKIDAYKQTLLEAVEAVTPPALKQFYELVEAMRDPDVKEAALFRLALKAAGKQHGLTPTAIVQAAQARIDCLPAEQQAFETDCDGKESVEVGGAKAEMEQLRQRRAAIETELATIDARMTALNETIGATTTRLAGDKASFSAAIAEVGAQVRAEKQTLQTNLGL